MQEVLIETYQRSEIIEFYLILEQVGEREYWHTTDFQGDFFNRRRRRKKMYRCSLKKRSKINMQTKLV